MAKGLFGKLDTDRNENLSLKEMFKPFAAADKNKDFTVDFDEFTNMMRKGKRSICK